MLCRSPHGERGLKSVAALLIAPPKCRSPHGERGLKYFSDNYNRLRRQSLPARGAWVEIYKMSDFVGQTITSLPARGAWVEIVF